MSLNYLSTHTSTFASLLLFNIYNNSHTLTVVLKIIAIYPILYIFIHLFAQPVSVYICIKAHFSKEFQIARKGNDQTFKIWWIQHIWLAIKSFFWGCIFIYTVLIFGLSPILVYNKICWENPIEWHRLLAYYLNI